MFELGQKVRVRDNAYKNSDDPTDFEIRGQIVTIGYSLEKALGEGWRDQWECFDDAGDCYHLTSDEIEPGVTA